MREGKGRGSARRRGVLAVRVGHHTEECFKGQRVQRVKVCTRIASRFSIINIRSILFDNRFSENDAPPSPCTALQLLSSCSPAAAVCFQS